MNAEQVAALRAVLGPTGWVDRTAGFARTLRRTARGGLLVIGPQAAEPWHMTAHLADESRLAGLTDLVPTLVRWSPPPGAPPHLSVGLDRLCVASREETLLVVSQPLAPPELLERVHDVLRAGVTVFALDTGDPDLDGLAHESLPVPANTLSFDAAQHLVSSALAYDSSAGGRHAAGRTGNPLRMKLARLLDAVSGTAPD